MARKITLRVLEIGGAPFATGILVVQQGGLELARLVKGITPMASAGDLVVEAAQQLAAELAEEEHAELTRRNTHPHLF
jgi:hypothetical protein